MDLSKVKEIIQKNKAKNGSLIAVLQDIQTAYGYVPKESVDIAAKEMSVYPSDIYGILTFYAQFYLEPRGKHIIKVCQGTACHVMGAKSIMDYLTDKLKTREGGVTKDGLFSIERVACLGCCGMAPVIMEDEDFHGRVTVQKIDEVIEKHSGDKGE